MASLPPDLTSAVSALFGLEATYGGTSSQVGLVACGGRTKLIGQGLPGLRLAAWRAVWGRSTPTRFTRPGLPHLTSREQNRLTVTKAQAVIAAAILRQLHAVITTGQCWDPVIATLGARPSTITPVAA